MFLREPFLLPLSIYMHTHTTIYTHVHVYLWSSFMFSWRRQKFAVWRSWYYICGRDYWNLTKISGSDFIKSSSSLKFSLFGGSAFGKIEGFVWWRYGDASWLFWFKNWNPYVKLTGKELIVKRGKKNPFFDCCVESEFNSHEAAIEVGSTTLWNKWTLSIGSTVKRVL